MTHSQDDGLISVAAQAVPRQPADRVAALVRAIPGVADLHPGMFGEVGTYLPGRRVPGVRLTETGIDVHVSVFFGAPVREVAAQIRRAVAAEVGGPVDVTIEDVTPMPGFLDRQPVRRAP